MNIIDSAEHWRCDDGTDEDEYAFTVVIATDENDKLYSATVQNRQSHYKPEEITEWSEIPIGHIHPRLPKGLRAFHGNINDSIYHKKPSYVVYDGSQFLAENLIREAKTYELLQEQHAFPYIAQYHGCIVSDGRIIGLALSKYDQTLDARSKQPFTQCQAAKWLEQIEEGLRVIHSKGLAHNDLNPLNVMVSDESAVIIDFDSCQPIGEDLLKGGTFGWCDHNMWTSAIINDQNGLDKLAHFLGEILTSNSLDQVK